MTKSKIMMIAVGLYLLVGCIFYLLFSFYNLSVNPAKWSPDARIGYAIIESVATFITLLVPIAYIDINDIK
jgi:uncharacterized membrane protein YedE/YeeE